jgi:hypothetical protein
MEINIGYWNKYKDRIADEFFDKPFDWLSEEQRKRVIFTFQSRMVKGWI